MKVYNTPLNDIFYIFFQKNEVPKRKEHSSTINICVQINKY